MNPSNTLWTKQYNLYAKIDTEGPRYLGFEKWWGGHVLLNAEEMQWIVDNLFVGNKLATAEIVTSDGMRIDLRNIRSPIICFCSQGDDITPPQQALGWITRPLRQRRRHPRQRPDHRLLRPRQDRPSRHLRLRRRGEEGARRVRLQHRLHRLPAARPLRGGDHADEPGPGDPGRHRGRRLPGPLRGPLARRRSGRWAATTPRTSAASRPWPRLSEINLGLYRTLLQPWVRAMVDAGSGRGGCAGCSPSRLQYELISDRNPLAGAVAARWPSGCAQNRQPAAADNPFLADPGAGLAPDRSRARRLPRSARRAGRGDASSRSTARRWCRRWLGLRASRRPPRPRPGREPEERAFVGRAGGRAAPEDRRGRPARGASSGR